MSRRWFVVDIWSGRALDDDYPDPELAEADARIRNRPYISTRYAVRAAERGEPRTAQQREAEENRHG